MKIIIHDTVALAAVSLAVAHDSMRYYLQGVYVEHMGDHLLITATNGKVIATARVDADPEQESFGPVILPMPTGIIDKLKSGLDATWCDGVWAVNGRRGPTLFAAKPIDGTFPNYRAITKGCGDSTHAAQCWGGPVLSTLANTAKLLGIERVVFSDGGHSGAHLIRYGETDRIYSVAMPCRLPDISINITPF